MNALSINPYFAAAPIQGAASVSPPRLPLPRMAKLPVAPVNASPVPHLTSLYHRDDPGPWGDRRYPGNCSGHLIKDLITFLGATTVYDPLSGSGTCKDVCRDLGIYCWSGDIHQGFDACEPRFTEAFSLCWIHPPYYRQKLYASDSRDLSREPTYEGFLARYDQLIRACAQAVKPGGHLAVLMGEYVDKDYGYLPLVHETKRIAFAAGLRQTMTDIIRFSHNASSSRKVYKSSFVPGLHDTCVVFTRPKAEVL